MKDMAHIEEQMKMSIMMELLKTDSISKVGVTYAQSNTTTRALFNT